MAGIQAVRAAQRAAGRTPYEPVVFSCPVTKSWSKAWRPSTLALALTDEGRPVTTKQSSNRFFMYSETGRMDLLADDPERLAATKLLDLSPRGFFEGCARQNCASAAGRPPYHYFTAKVQEAFCKLELPRWEELAVVDFPGARPDQLAYASVWLGGLGSSTQSHYDVAHNCLVQTHGFKRVGFFL